MTDIVVIAKKQKIAPSEACQNIGCTQKREPNKNQCASHIEMHKSYLQKQCKRRKAAKTTAPSNECKKLQEAYDNLLKKYQELKAEYTKLYNARNLK